MKFTKILSIFLVLILISACESDGGKAPVANSQDVTYEDGSQGTGVGYDDGAIESGDLGDTGILLLQNDLVANIGDRVFFDFNSAEISTISKATLDRQADWLQSNDSVTITIEGHCDERGTREFNLALGEQRANSAKEYLISKGVKADRIKTISYGKEYPEYPEASEAAWSKNRRAVSVVN